MQFRTPLKDTMLVFIGSAISAYVTWATAKNYSIQESVVILVGFVAILMGSAAVVSAYQFSRTAETLLDQLRCELHAETEAATARAQTMTEALGRPAQFFPKDLTVDDGYYFQEIARHVGDMKRGETVFIVTSHSPIAPTGRKQAVDDARRLYHAALENGAEHRGIRIKRILCLRNDMPQELNPNYLSLHFTDHCNRLLKIAEKDHSHISLKISGVFSGVDTLVIPGRVAAMTSDARDQTGKLEHVLCWLFFSPPNRRVIDTLEEWCVGIDNAATPLTRVPDGIETQPT